MTKVNLITKYGLENEVNSLLENGYSVFKVRDVVRGKHQDIPELANISHMAIQRFKDSKIEKDLIELDDRGEDLSEVLRKEYLDATKTFLEQTEWLTIEAKALYEEAKQDGSIMDRAKIIKELRDNINQEQKIWEGKMNYGARQFKIADNISQKKVQNLNIFMIDLANNLCPECKRQILEKLKNIVSE